MFYFLAYFCYVLLIPSVNATWRFDQFSSPMLERRSPLSNEFSIKVLSLNKIMVYFVAKSMIGVSDQCWPHAKVLICFHTFPLCGNDRKLPLNRQFCQDECHFLEMFVCRQEFQLAKNINNIKQFVPSCKALPHPGTTAHSNCWRLPSLDESNFRKLFLIIHLLTCFVLIIFGHIPELNMIDPRKAVLFLLMHIVFGVKNAYLLV